MHKTASTLPATPPNPASIVLGVITLIGSIALASIGFFAPVVMGIVQGLGEFLPISSSAHLILIPWFFGWEGGSIGTLTFDVALHIGTLFAVVGYFWRDWIRLIQAVPAAGTWALAALRGNHATPAQAEYLLIAIIIGTIPGAVAGILLEKQIESLFRSPLLLAGTLSAMGVLLFLADRQSAQARSLEQLSWRDALLIGVAQAAALIPGVSRSGATMTMGRFLAFDRAAAARFSFLLSTPITLAAVLVKLDDILSIRADEIAIFLVGVVVSGAIGTLSIHFLLGYIRRIGFGIFAVYRLVLAAIIVIVYVARQ